MYTIYVKLSVGLNQRCLYRLKVGGNYLYIQAFLEKDVQSKVQIIEYLYAKEMMWVSTKELMEETYLTQSTTLKYLSEIETHIKNFGIGKISIEKEKNNGFKIYFSQKDYFYKLRLKIIGESLILAIWNEFFFNNELNAIQFSIDCYCSMSTFKRKIKQLNRIGIFYDFRITSKKNVYRLIGNEKSIRLVVSKLFWEIYGGTQWPFFNIDERKLIVRVNTISEILNNPIPDTLKDIIVFNYAISLTRYHKKNEIILDINQSQEWVKLKEINHAITNYLPINLVQFLMEESFQSEDEIHFHMCRLQTGLSFYKTTDIVTYVINEHKKRNTEIYIASKKFLKKLIKKINIGENNLSKEASENLLIASICLHYEAFLYQELPEYKKGISNFFVDYTNLNHFVQEILKELAEELGYQLFNRKFLLLNQYMFIFSELLPLTFLENKITVCFDEPMDEIKEKAAKALLHGYLDNHYNVEIYGIRDVIDFEENIPDVILSSHYTEKLASKYSGIPVLILKSGVFDISLFEISLCKQVLNILNKHSHNSVERIDELKDITSIQLRI